MLDTVSTASKLDIVTSACAPINYVIGWQLAMNAERTKDVESPTMPSPLLDLLNPECSPVVMAQQWYAAIVTQPVTVGIAATVSGLCRHDGLVVPDQYDCMVRTHMLGSSSLAARCEQFETRTFAGPVMLR